jgi:hypothetical protein
MTVMGAYNCTRTEQGYTLTHAATGAVQGHYPTAQKAMFAAVELTAAARKAK